MRLQSSIGCRRGGKEYPKHQIVIPNNVIKQLGWNPREYLEPSITKKGLFIYKAEPKQHNRRPDYEQFKESIVDALMVFPNGCTWEELRLKTGLPQKTPSPIWTKRMEDEKILTRLRDPRMPNAIWKLQGEYLAAIASTMNGWVSKSQDGARHRQ
jgi:hypothetical protein